MPLVTPGIGLIFWMLIAFSILLFILGKFAWKPILKMLHEREESIEKALQAAEEAKLEMQKLQANNEQIVAEARKQADTIIKEAREIKEKMISDAKNAAAIEAEKVLNNAKAAIESEKNQAMNEIRNQIADFSVLIAEKIIRKELSNENKQKEYIDSLLKDINVN
ncbi:MAG TPA: F0F1 ATP synthase subunit B [Bacteroidales bacterium]|jgi:F-type H+-transporting ATPase subunit b|nr:F0F1 ATP synthase subunit B [Bacteroidales bacterium]HOU98019.1 F0F1 ATP synthase subunit B [Bacteroidales bacterium]